MKTINPELGLFAKEKSRRFYANKIYKALFVYDDEHPEFDCFMPADNGSYSLFDCWVCDKEGNIHPGYNVSPVPVHADSLGKVVNTLTVD